MQATIELMGNWTNRDRKWGYSAVDVGILTSDRGVNKILRILSGSNLDHKFRFIFLRGPKVHKYIEHGEMSPELCRGLLGVEIEPNDDCVTVIYTNNRGAEKIPMTSWCIMHRLSHALRHVARDEFFIYERINDIIASAYNINRYGKVGTGTIMQQILTMKSARESKLLNLYEGLHEAFVQNALYELKFNSFKSGMYKSGKQHFGRKYDTCYTRENPETLNNRIQSLIYQYVYEKECQIDNSYGKILVM